MAGLSRRMDSGGNSQFNWRNHIFLGRPVDIQIKNGVEVWKINVFVVVNMFQRVDRYVGVVNIKDLNTTVKS